MLLFLLLISLFPVLVWSYIFSYIDWDKLNKSRFILWVFSWVVAVIPIVFFEQFFSFFRLSFLLQIFSNFNLVWFWVFLLVFILIILVSAFIYLFIQKRSHKKAMQYIFSSFWVFIIFILFSSSLLYLADYLWLFSRFSIWDTELNFSGVALNSFRLVLFYYFFIAVIEELSKHINFLGYSINYISSVQKWVLYAIFATLGFVFVENMLYLYNVYSVSSFSWEFFRVYLFRFVFSLMVHVFCSSLLAYYFTKAYLNFKSFFRWEYIKLLFTWIFFAVSLHAFFDISLTYWWSFIMIIYFLVGYFYLTGVFYRE